MVMTAGPITPLTHYRHRDPSRTMQFSVLNRNRFKFLIQSRALWVRFVLDIMEQLWRMARLARGRHTPFLVIRMDREFRHPPDLISKNEVEYLKQLTSHISSTLLGKMTIMQGSFNDLSSRFSTKLLNKTSSVLLRPILLVSGEGRHFAQQQRQKLPSLKYTMNEFMTYFLPTST